jgi:hypothetical protein
MLRQYSLFPQDVGAFISIVQSDYPWWEISDREFELAAKKPSSTFWASGELDRANRLPDEDYERFFYRVFSAFYIRESLKWHEHNEFKFILPDQKVFIVVLSNIDPITPILRPERKRSEIQFGWGLGWSADSVRREVA